MPTLALRRAAVVTAFALAFVVNPSYVAGCVASSSDDDEAARVARAEAELLAQLDDVNGQGRWSFGLENGDEYELLLALTQSEGEDEHVRATPRSPLFPVAHACGQYTFHQRAAACDTLYQLAVEGTLTLRRLGERPVTVADDLPVSGLLVEYGELQLQIGDAGTLHFGREAGGEFEVASFVAEDLGDEALDVAFPPQR